LSLSDLAGPIWILTKIGDSKVVGRNALSIVIKDLKITGSGGCNHFFSSIKGKKNTVIGEAFF